MDRTGERRTVRAMPLDFTARQEDSGEMILEGYFSVFNSDYEIWPGATESIAPGAFAGSLANDVRALINHDTTLVLGRTKNRTLEIREDSRGLWGRVVINPKDGDAVNAYERVSRGDVDGCSIGFSIRDEETEFHEDGSIHWTIKDVELYEVSVCTFPAYEDTNITARQRQADEIRKRQLEAWKQTMLRRVKDGVKGAASEEKD